MDHSNAGEWAAQELWRQAIAGTAPDSLRGLAFPMLGRLAELLLRTNSTLRRAIQATYSHVFLDEVQDTTSVQYDLTQTAFMGSSAVLTAVGDDKQRIMSWAGARRDIFERFRADFGAECERLVRNYRSAPELVEIQARIAKILHPGQNEIKSFAGLKNPGVCRILEFKDSALEAQHLANMIAEEIEDGERSADDYCILVRQRCGSMTQELVRQLNAQAGVRARDETAIQDLISEPLAQALCAWMRLATMDRDPEAWGNLLEFLETVLGGSEDEDGEAAELAQAVITEGKKAIGDGIGSEEELEAALEQFCERIGPQALVGAFPQYRQGRYWRRVLENLAAVLWAEYERSGDWQVAARVLLGEGVIPAMTIHKSKGLEYHTVIFVGLEDSSWWNFANDDEEEIRAFFVAFSRASQRVLFTFCEHRDDGRGRGAMVQSRREINSLYDILHQAGVESERVE
jgi:superfamily I DNA/RNA helicase